MTDKDRNQTECTECETQPKLYETPFKDTGYIVACECDSYSIDVSECINGNSLMHPLSGKWSNIDHDHEADRMDTRE